MPGLEADTSSYALPTQPNFLDTASKLQGLQQQQQSIQSGAIQIDQQKFNLVKDRFATIAKEVPALISKPDLNENDIRQWYQNKVKDGFITADQAADKISQIPPTAGMPAPQAALTLKNHLGSQLQQAQGVMEALEYHLGKGGAVDTGASVNPTLSSPKPGFAGNPQAGGIVQPQPGIPTQPGPTTPQMAPGGTRDENGNPIQQGTPTIRGPSAPPTGLPIAPGALPVGPAPVPPGMKLNGGRVTGIDVGPDQPNLGAPKSIVTGNSPLFEAGKTQFVQDQQTASAKSQALIPILQAIPLMKDIMAGPGTAGFTHAVAALKAFGFIPTNVNDTTAIRQEVVKKLNAYVSTNPISQRSDAAQTLTAASNPSPDIQLLPALTKLAKDAVAQDRTAISRPGAFNNDDFSQYGKHTTNYATTIDQNAMKLDQMEPDEREALKNKYSKEVKGRRIQLDTPQAKKFWDTLRIVKQQGLFDINKGE